MAEVIEKVQFLEFATFLIYCYTTAGIAWLPQQHKKMVEQTYITYNEVCIIIHQGLENIKTFLSRPRLFLQD